MAPGLSSNQKFLPCLLSLTCALPSVTHSQSLHSREKIASVYFFEAMEWQIHL